MERRNTITCPHYHNYYYYNSIIFINYLFAMAKCDIGFSKNMMINDLLNGRNGL